MLTQSNQLLGLTGALIALVFGRMEERYGPIACINQREGSEKQDTKEIIL